MSSVVGIDLGTTNTVAACVRGGRVHVLADEAGGRLLPSVVSFHPNGEVLVGRAAKDRRLVDARNTIGSIKRLIGRTWGSPELERARKRFPFEMKEGPGHAAVVTSRGKDYTLAEISALVLKRSKQIAEQSLGDTVEKAVITVPANFNELQRASTKVAGRIAGLEVLRILNEPTAAALAYGFGRGGSERIAVYDFGGGTFDCTLLEMNGNVFEVLATAGDSFLGGDDIDAIIADRMADAFLLQQRFDARTDTQQLERLRVAGEQIKIDLSSAAHTEVHLREMAFGDRGAHLDLRFGLTRAELEGLVQPLVQKTLDVCQEALTLAGLPVSGFDKVILVGGSTRIPLVRQTVERFFGTVPMDRLNPDEVVGMGAAIQAAALTDYARRRSIPAPPAPGQKRQISTLRGLADQRPSSPSQPSADETAPRKPYPTLPADDEVRGARVPSIPPAELDIDPQKEITLQRSVSDLHEGYAELPPTRPSIPPSANQLLALSVPESTDGAPTQPFKRTPPPSRPPPEIPPSPDSTLDALPGILDESQAGPAPFAPTPTPAPARAPAPAPSRAASPDRTQKLPALPSTPPPLPISPPVPATVPPPAPLPAPILIDVTPRALVVETAGGFADAVVLRNSRIPCSRTRAFSPGRDHQTSVRIRVAQGESAIFAENTYLGELELSGLRSGPRGEVTIAVAFEVDASGIVRVKATDTGTGREARATLQLIGVAAEESIARMAATTAGMRVVGSA